MPTWAEIRGRVDALPEPFKSLAAGYYLEASKTKTAYPASEVGILFELNECMASIEWDASDPGFPRGEAHVIYQR